MADAVEAAATAYAIEWGPKAPCKIKQLPPPSAVLDGTTDSAATGTSIGSRAEALRRTWGIAVDTDDTTATSSAPTSRLFVVRDMDSEDANRVICTALDVDPAFVDCHITRRRYHPQDRQWRIFRQGHHRSLSDSGGSGGGDGGHGSRLGRADAPGLTSFMARDAYSYVYPEVLTLTVLKTESGATFDSGANNEAAGQDEGYRSGRAGASGPRTAEEEKTPPAFGARGVGSTEAGLGLRVSTATTAAASISQLSIKASKDSADPAGEAKGKAPREQLAGTTSYMSSRRAPLATSKAPFLKRSDSGVSTVAVFCRASVWTGPTAHVLFLDSSPSSTTLEDALTDTLDEAMAYDSALSLARTSAESSEISTPEATADLVNHVVAALAYDQWLDFFDSISSSSQNTSYANRKLYWDMCHYLEQNLTVSRFHEKKQRLVRLQQMRRSQQPYYSEEPSLWDGLDVASVDDWQGLLTRLERLVALLPLRLQKQRKATATSSGLGSPETSFNLNRMATGDIRSSATRRAAAVGDTPSAVISSTEGGGNRPDNRPFSATDDGQAALSRVTYLGGILLPFSIVSGILSMSDPFGPGNPLFWVFWVITLPLTLFTVFIIYADGIRKAEVWVEVAGDGIQEAINKGQMITAAAAAAAFGPSFGIGAAAAEAGHESDLDVETNPVASAVRRSGHRGRRQHSVPVSTTCGSRSKVFYRLSEPPSPVKTWPTTTMPVPVSASPPAAHSVEKASAASSTYEKIEPALVQARSKIGFHLPAMFFRHKEAAASKVPLQRFTGSVPTTASAPLFGPGDDTVVIDMGPTMASGVPGQTLAVAPSAEFPGRPLVVLEHPNDGSKPKIWRRQQLGWYGAAKSIVGYQKPRKHMSPPAEFVRVERTKTKTY